jgi:glycine cleavage system H protein
MKTAKLFSEKHEWIELEDDVATVGISEYAQNSLGDIVYVLQPEIGQEMEKNGTNMNERLNT